MLMKADKEDNKRSTFIMWNDDEIQRLSIWIKNITVSL
jgi:hypothetical protein